MTRTTKSKPDVTFLQSLASLPMWVKVWLVALGATNLGILAFLNQPKGPLVAALVLTGIVLSKVFVNYGGGLTRLVGVGHIIGWVPLVALILFARPEGTSAYDIYLTILLVMNTISILFDINDFRLWLAGDRDVFS
ncbi:hypothetical protein [Sulfitobacter sp.]|jgi:hypothetical protein|uniref:hypothetical protein n=1 Tax=Sulfitobacter sp. TaxID=1903071 RepID=UPI0039E706AD